jgi:catabolite regulation protein CreA
MESKISNRQTILNNKPDIVIRDNEKGTRMLIKAGISGDRNVFKKETEKVLKYKYLMIEIQRVWNAKANVIPVITRATRTISKSLRQYLSNIPGKHEVKELQKNIHIGHCTRTAESANLKA